jgi:hypothetical protein
MHKSPQLRFRRIRQHSRTGGRQEELSQSADRPFRHEINPTGGVDSICQRCNALIDSSKDEWSLLQSEAVHLCVPLQNVM